MPSEGRQHCDATGRDAQPCGTQRDLQFGVHPGKYATNREQLKTGTRFGQARTVKPVGSGGDDPARSRLELVEVTGLTRTYGPTTEHPLVEQE